MATLFCLFAFTSVATSAEDWTVIRERSLAAYSDNANAVDEGLDRAQKANVPSDYVSTILLRAVATSISAEDFVALVDRVTAARIAGLPTRPFKDKALEGIAKNVRIPLILSVLDKKLETYTEARGTIAHLAGKPEDVSRALESVVLAMERGVSSQALRQIYSSEIKDPPVVFHSAQAFADLADMGFSEAQSSRIVGEGIRGGYLRSGHSAFVQIAGKVRKLGHSYQDITKVMELGLQRGHPLSEIAKMFNDDTTPDASDKEKRLEDRQGRSRSVGPGSDHTGIGRRNLRTAPRRRGK